MEIKDRDINWIRGALQTAIALENCTIPIYCSAMYSLEVQNYPVYNILRSVVMEEMLHMAAAANMVAALGDRPRIRELDAVGELRRGLPGNIAPGLRARCANLSRSQLDAFMRIEAPESLVPEASSKTSYGGRSYPTIGAFYEEIKQAIFDNADAIRQIARGPMKSNQVGGNLGYACIDPTSGVDGIEQFIGSIELIQDQGEGADTTRMSGEESGDELSHYARFAELKFGRRYEGPLNRDKDSVDISESQRRYYTGEEITWPTVINTLAVPNDGYEAILKIDANREEVSDSLRKFDENYTRMMVALDDCWNGPVSEAWPNLGKAVYEMNELRVVSCFEILRHQVPVEAIQQLERLYPIEFAELAALTDLTKPVFYGPRFINRETIS